MQTTKINFREMLSNMIDGNSEDVDFLIGFAERQQAEGKISDEEILQEVAQHLARQSNFQRVRDIVALNQKAVEAITGLLEAGHWGNLTRISEHALKSAIEAARSEKKTKLFGNLVWGHEIRLAVMKMGSDEFEDIFTKEFLAKFNKGAR
jgi:hypothetical protein